MHYNTGKEHDAVFLPSSPRGALEVGVTSGSLFETGNDIVSGGDHLGIADLVAQAMVNIDFL